MADCVSCVTNGTSCSNACSQACTYYCSTVACKGCTGSCDSTNVAEGGGGGCDCSGECKGNCKDTCKNLCNTGCDGEAQTPNLADLDQINKLIKKDDIQKIYNFIYNETKRHLKEDDAKTASFSIKERALQSDIKVILDNLTLIGHPSDYSVTSKTKISESFAKDLIEKAKNANKDTVPLP